MCQSVYLCRSRGGGNLRLTTQGFKCCEKYKICYNSDMKHHYKNKQGFTLAEVLITLGIIGIVAALTIPMLVARHQEKVWLTSFFRVYSTLNNAYKRVQEEYGTFDNWSGSTLGEDSFGRPSATSSDPQKIYEYLISPYIEINQQFLPTNDNWTHINGNNCFPEQAYYLNKSTFPNMYIRTYPAVSLKSGECIVLGYSSYGDFVVDTNSKKGPNILGKDIFIFSFDPNRKEFIKTGSTGTWGSNDAIYCDLSYNNWIPGYSCGYWILRHRNMDYLHLSHDELIKRW